MDTTEIIVLISGTGLIALVLVYFFGPRKAARASERLGTNVQEVQVTVKGGYSPDVIEVEAGRPVRLNFFRDEAASCSDRVVLGDFGISRDLPAFQTTAVEFVPGRPGEFAFTCGMSMMRGKLIVRPRPSN